MSWLIRQWHRFQLARELLAQYEYDEAHRKPWPEAVTALTVYSKFTTPPPHAGAQKWREAVEAHLATREATRGTEAS